MQRYGKSGVLFSDVYFSEESLALLLQPRDELQAERKSSSIEPISKPPVEHTLESAFDVGWEEVIKDKELQEAIQQAGLTKENGFANYMMSLSAPMSAGEQEKLTDSLTSEYVVKEEDGKYVHYLKGERILAIPSDVESANEISLNAEAILYGIFVLIDILFLIAAICNVYVATAKEGFVKPLMGPKMRIFLLYISAPYYVNIFKKYYSLGKKVPMALEVIRGLFDSGQANFALSTFLDELKPLQVALAIAGMIGAMLLAVGTSGGAIIYKISLCVGALIILVVDILYFVTALGYPEPAEPPAEPEPPYPPGPPSGGCYYIGNNNTKEIHDSCNITSACQFGRIKAEHKVFYGSLQDVENATTYEGYNGCAFCMPEYNTG